MKQNFCKILWLAVFFITCGTHFAQADMISPAWKIGDQWQVKAVYHSSLKKGEWSSPIVWEYRVISCDEVTSSGSRCVLDVKAERSALELTAQLTYVRNVIGKRQTFFLEKAVLSKMRRGRKMNRTLTYGNKFPVCTEQTLIPFDTPVFPLVQPSSNDFSAVRQVSQSLKVAETIRQDVRLADKIPELPDWPADKPLTEVRCTRKDGTLLFMQYWPKDSPWPVFGRNGNMKYCLVEK